MLGNPDILETVPNDIMAWPMGVGSFLEPVVIEDGSDLEEEAEQTIRYSPAPTLEDGMEASTTLAGSGAPEETSEELVPIPGLDTLQQDLEAFLEEPSNDLAEVPADLPSHTEAPATPDARASPVEQQQPAEDHDPAGGGAFDVGDFKAGLGHA